MGIMTVCHLVDPRRPRCFPSPARRTVLHHRASAKDARAASWWPRLASTIAKELAQAEQTSERLAE